MSMEEYIERIPTEKRNIAINTSSEIAKIAGKIESWELIAHLLGLSHPEVIVIKRTNEHYEEQKLVNVDYLIDYRIISFFPSMHLITLCTHYALNSIYAVIYTCNTGVF